MILNIFTAWGSLLALALTRDRHYHRAEAPLDLEPQELTVVLVAFREGPS